MATDTRGLDLDADQFRVSGGLPSLVFSDRFWSEAKGFRPRKWNERSDSRKLRRWCREDGEIGAGPHPTNSTQELRPEKVPSYTQDEYIAHLQSSTWSKEDTDTLFSLCRQFDVKFIVVHDRFESSTERSIEDLKERYYEVSKKMDAVRAAAAGIAPNVTLYIFDKEREIQRKKNLETLHSRPADAIHEEEFLFHELKRRELHERKWAAERDHLVRMYGHHELPTPMQLPPIPGSTGAFDPRKKNKRLQGEMGPPNEPAKRQRTTTGGGFPGQEVSSALTKREIPPGVFVRSHRLLMPRASNWQGRFKELLEEYHMLLPPVMPSAAVCDVADEVRGNLLVLLDVKKTIEKMEHDLVTLRERKRMLLAGEARPAPVLLDSGGTSDEYDEEAAAARRKKKGGSGGAASGAQFGMGGVLKKQRIH